MSTLNDVRAARSDPSFDPSSDRGLVCPRCTEPSKVSRSYHGAAMLAARAQRNFCQFVIARMPRYKSEDEIPEHLF